MALSITEANAVSTKYFDGTLGVQVYDSSPLWARLKSKNLVTLDGGSAIQFPVRYKESGTAQALGARTQLAYTQVETRTAGVVEYGRYANHAMISWDEREANSGSAKIINLMKDKYKELEEDLYEKMADDLFATTAVTNGLTPIDDIVDSADTYAGIAVADAAAWAGQEDSSTTRLTLYGSTGSLATMMNNATLGSKKPDLLLTTRNLFSKLESLVEPQKRYEDVEMAKIGFVNVQFHGATAVADAHCPTTYLFGLCTDEWELRVHKDFNFKATDWRELDQVGFPNALVKVVSFSGNIICRNRRVNLKYSALDYTA